MTVSMSHGNLADELADVIGRHLSYDARACMQDREDYNDVVTAVLTRWQLTPIPGSTPGEPWTREGSGG